MASGRAPRLQVEYMTAPSSLVRPENDLAARANGMDPALAAVESQASTAAKEDVMQVVRIGLDL
ncbi:MULTISPECIES: hypothetical protein, partial [unclassified Bradyrhizobium]|uniref:hypothetical protein n=1 Tax=unclassified Bradyrhizobium TaxID=2631580 RepID=UPI001FF7D6B3